MAPVSGREQRARGVSAAVCPKGRSGDQVALGSDLPKPRESIEQYLLKYRHLERQTVQFREMEHNRKLLQALARTKHDFQTSFVRKRCRIGLRILLSKLPDMEGISEDVKRSAHQDFLADLEVGILKAQRNAVRELLETLEISVCGQIPLPVNLFAAVEITAKAVLPQGMRHSIAGANRRVTVYVDPDHAEFTSAEILKDLLCRYLLSTAVVSNGMKASR